jgi:hypothetical protein
LCRDTGAIQGWLGHRSITSTAIYTAPAPNRFKDFWRIQRAGGTVGEDEGTGGDEVGEAAETAGMGIGAGLEPTCGTGKGAAPGGAGVGTGPGPCATLIGGVGPSERG